MKKIVEDTRGIIKDLEESRSKYPEDSVIYAKLSLARAHLIELWKFTEELQEKEHE